MIVPDDLTLRAMDRAQFIRTVMWSRLKLGMETTRFEKLSEYNQGLAAQDQVSSWTEWVERVQVYGAPRAWVLDTRTR